MTCDDHVRTRQFYARRAKTANARCQVCDIVDVSPKRRRLDSRRLVVSGGGGDESDSKVLQLDDIDCISNLPQELIDCILKLFSVKDAARTSVLSKEWRYKWAMNPQLILDKSFFLRLTSNIRKRDKIARCSAFSRAIEKIILVHSGDILGISLYFPLKLDQCSATQWIEYFLNKRTRHLELNNYENHAYEIPSCLFDCVELINLLLHTWIFYAPKEFTSFRKLLHVKLMNITFNSDISFGTRLKFLVLEYCTGIQHLGSHFTHGNRLTTVSIIGIEQIDWQWFECTSLLRFLRLELEPVSSSILKKPINIIKYLSNLPSILGFHTSGFALEVWRPVAITNGLATKAENLKELVLNRLGPYNPFQIINALYLIRCLPNLQGLQITLVDDGRRFNLLGFSTMAWEDMSLGLLRHVKIQGVVASYFVFYLLKFLLASSPSLEGMLLMCSGKVTNPREKLEIKQELQNFPKRSSSAKIVFRTCSKGCTSISRY